MDERIVSLKAQLAESQASLAKAVKIIRGMEWVDDDGFADCCCTCGTRYPEHQPTCGLANFLKAHSDTA